MLDSSTLERLGEQDRWPTTEAEALLYKILLQYFEQGIVMRRGHDNRLQRRHIDEQVEQQNRAVHATVVRMFPQFKYIKMLSLWLEPEEWTPVLRGVNDAGFYMKLTEDDLVRDQAVNDMFKKLFEEHLLIRGHSQELSWEKRILPANVTIKFTGEGGSLH